MRIIDLIEELHELVEGGYENCDVQIATWGTGRHEYPLAFSLDTVRADVLGEDEEDGDTNVVWITAGSHPAMPYAPHALFN
jgi:hypothetical protein